MDQGDHGEPGYLQFDAQLAGRGRLVGCDHHIIAPYVRARDADQLAPTGAQHRDQLIDQFRPYIEGWVENSLRPRPGGRRADEARSWALGLRRLGARIRRAVAE